MAQVEQRCGARAAFPAYVISPDRQASRERRRNENESNQTFLGP